MVAVLKMLKMANASSSKKIKNKTKQKQVEALFLLNLFLQLSAVLLPHGGGMSFFRFLLRIRSARGLTREDDEVHRQTSTSSALFSTYASCNDKMFHNILQGIHISSS